MSNKRKDHKGRLLRTGESQRGDLIYQYRYTDLCGKRRSIYDSDLQGLRRKEKELQRQLDDGIDYEAGQITVLELLKRYVSLKQGVRHNTRMGYKFVLNLVAKEEFGSRRICTVKVSDAKLWFLKLHQDGKGYSTITSVRGVVKPAFQMACDEDAIRKNPFIFKLTDVVPNDSERRIALTEEQLRTWMDFIRQDETYSKYYDEFVVLLDTGLRVSEFCGLTRKDLGFEEVPQAAPGQAPARHHAPRVPVHFLHELRQRRYGHQEPAIPDGPLRRGRDAERVHPRELLSRGESDGQPGALLV